MEKLEKTFEDSINDFYDSNFLKINREMLKCFPFEEAIIISELYHSYEFAKKNGRLKEGGFFKFTNQHILNKYNLKKGKAAELIPKLEKLGIVEKKLLENPAVRYVAIRHVGIYEILEEKRNQREHQLSKIKEGKLKSKEVRKKNILNTEDAI